MDEKLQAALAELINKANQGVDGAVSFMSAELPDVIHQLLVWNVISSCAWAIVGLVVLGISALVMKSWKIMSRDELQAAYDAGEKWTRFGGSGSLTSIKFDSLMRGEGVALKIFSCSLIIAIGALIFVGNLLDVAKILIAPKIWLIEYAASLAK